MKQVENEFVTYQAEAAGYRAKIELDLCSRR